MDFEEVAVPHIPQPPAWAREHEVVPGAQWAAVKSASRTSTQFVAGRGFSGCGVDCTLHHHDAPPAVDTDAIISRVLARLKAQGVAEAPWMLR